MLAVIITPAVVAGICLPLCPLSLGDSDRDISPQSQSYYFFMKGTLAALDGDSEEALRQFDQAAMLDRNSTYVKLKQAEELLNLNRTEDAQRILKAIEASENRNPEFYVLSARLSSQLGNILKSLKDLDFAVNSYLEQDNNLKAREIALTKVALQADNRDYSGATQTLEKFLKKNPDDEIAFYFLGKIHSIFQNKAAAKVAYQKAIELRPGFPAASKALGLELELEGKLDAAFKVYQAANQSNAGDEELIQKLINLSLIRDDYKSALDYIHQYLEMKPDDLQNLMRAGLIHYKLKEFDLAEENLRQAATKDAAPMDRISFYIGSIAFEKHKFEEAASTLSKIPDDSDYFVEAQLQASTVLASHLNRSSEALNLLDRALGARKDNPDLILAKAAILDQDKQIEKAISTLDNARQTQSQNEKILFMLGSLQDRAGHFEDSVKTMKSILEFNKDNPHALNHIGYGYADRGIHLDAAESMLKRAIQLAPQNGFILDSLGWTYHKMNKFKKAAEIFDRANKLSPNQPIIMEHMADNFYKMGEKKLALDLYQKIMRFSLEPNDETENNPTETSTVKERVREKLALIADSSVR